MSGDTSYDAEAMKAAGADFSHTYDAVDKLMNDLRECLGDLRAKWDGNAARVFEQTMIQWGVEFDKVLNELDAMADRLIGGSGHAQDAEDFAIKQGSFFKTGDGR